MTRHATDEVLALTRRYPEMIEDREPTLDEKRAFIAETVEAAGTYSKARTIRIEPALGISMELLGELLARLEDTFREVLSP